MAEGQGACFHGLVGTFVPALVRLWYSWGVWKLDLRCDAFGVPLLCEIVDLLDPFEKKWIGAYSWRHCVWQQYDWRLHIAAFSIQCSERRPLIRASDTLVTKSRDAFQPLRPQLSLKQWTCTCKFERRSTYKNTVPPVKSSTKHLILLSIESIGALSSHRQTKFGEFFAPSQFTSVHFKLVDQIFDQIP